ncbi:hypothetical protein GSI_05796 [Ganoderma sinense ZZ0214-1]|uniref:Uncharacterized protein n=1 Tax=Ganoderma sinense ZZ0214-1 TaxID=1077348 RepID=A0A2G8SBG6_9APHY|nr:hypothetical protein GSI_05796 [Ganoderma sinense ZZ0214-1]
MPTFEGFRADGSASDSEKDYSGADSHERSVDAHEEPHLNFDVLRLVCDYLIDIPNVLSFALTCSALTEDALRRRLRMAPVVLRKGESVNSFHAFLFSNEPLARASCMYGLKIRTSYYDDQFRGQSDSQIIDNHLMAILEAATHIQYLDFQTSISDVVFDAVVKLTTVRELRIFNDVLAYQGPFLKGLAIFQSPLRSLRIAGCEPGGRTVYASFLHDRLSHLAPTLEFLDLDEFPIDILPSSVTTQFTAVRSLRLQTFCTPECDLLGVLVQLFPNLDNTLDLGPLDAYLGEDDVPAFRERCKETQERHVWSGLDHVVCAAAYFLALQCPIRRMSTKGLRQVGRAVPPEAADKLTHVVMSTRFGVGYRQGARRKADNVHWDRFIDRLVRSIQHLRLTHVRIVFSSAVYQSSRTPPRHDGPFKAVRGVDLCPAATRFVDAMPSLRYLFLTAYGRTVVVPAPKLKNQSAFDRRVTEVWHSSGAWQVVHGEEAPLPGEPADAKVSSSCVELSHEAKERIMVQEDLHLSREEEASTEACCPL